MKKKTEIKGKRNDLNNFRSKNWDEKFDKLFKEMQSIIHDKRHKE